MALTADQVRSFLLANPGLTDAEIASLANQYGVSAQTLSEATSVPVAQIEQRATAAGVPLGLLSTEPAAPTPTTPSVTPNQVLPEDVRKAFESQNLTQDQYDTLARYFGNPLLMDEATRDPNKPTIKEYVNNNRSGYEFASFAATRSTQHGGAFGTANEKEQLGKLGALVAPYIGAESGPIKGDAEGGLYVSGPGGADIPLTSIGDNKYLATIGRPLFGQDKTRYNVGIEYTLDPNTNQLRISNPSIQAFQTTSDGDFFKQAFSLLAPIALTSFFPWLSSSIGSALAGGASAATQAAIGNAVLSGLTTGAITGDAEKALIAGALVGGGTYATESGLLGDIMDSTGLGDFRVNLNIPNTSTVTNIPGIDGFGAVADEVGGGLLSEATTPPVVTEGLLDVPTLVTPPADQIVTPVSPADPSNVLEYGYPTDVITPPTPQNVLEFGFPQPETPFTPAPADVIPGYATPENVFEYGFPEPQTPFVPAPADVIPGYATPENVFEYGFPEPQTPFTPVPVDVIPASNIKPTDALRAASTLQQLAQQPQPQAPQTPEQTGQSGPLGVDYAGLLNLLASQARTTGLLGTRFQPTPVNLSSLLG
jgi:hypothetical protein